MVVSFIFAQLHNLFGCMSTKFHINKSSHKFLHINAVSINNSLYWPLCYTYTLCQQVRYKGILLYGRLNFFLLYKEWWLYDTKYGEAAVLPLKTEFRKCCIFVFVIFTQTHRLTSFLEEMKPMLVHWLNEKCNGMSITFLILSSLYFPCACVHVHLLRCFVTTTVIPERKMCSCTAAAWKRQSGSPISLLHPVTYRRTLDTGWVQTHMRTKVLYL